MTAKTIINNALVLADTLTGLATRPSSSDVQQAFRTGRLLHAPARCWRLAILRPYLAGSATDVFRAGWECFRFDTQSATNALTKVKDQLVGILWLLYHDVVQPLLQLESRLLDALCAERPHAKGRPGRKTKQKNTLRNDWLLLEAGHMDRPTKTSLFRRMQKDKRFMKFVAENNVTFSIDVCRHVLHPRKECGQE